MSSLPTGTRKLLLLALVIGCSPTSPSSGCDSPRRATDVSLGGVTLLSRSLPCTQGTEAVRGSEPHLIVGLNMDGQAEPFLVAIRVDGVLRSMHEVRGDAYGVNPQIDAGLWDSPDGEWQDVEVIIDPLNLFREADESNNRGAGQVRIVGPDLALRPQFTGFVVPREAGGDGFTQVSQVPAGTPVDLWLSLTLGGPYTAVVRSIHSGTTLSVTDTTSVGSCGDMTYSPLSVTRWTPPGPGVYEVTFEVAGLGGLEDPPANNRVVRSLAVIGSPMATGASTGFEPSAGDGR